MSLKADIYKSFGSFTLDVSIDAGNETLALLGASGCGKSLTLKCIAGIIKPDRGRIELDGRVLFDSEKRINLSPQQRNTGLMFQNYALFPNMTVLQNIRCGARRKHDRLSREENVRTIMESFGLAELSKRLPSQLSGGQQQRVALARILVSEPEILLLDEPFSALDSHLRFRLEGELRQVIRDFGKTVILVSHDRDEVYRLSDSVAVINSGRVETQGSREQVFSQPGSVNAARLTGCKNISRLEPLGGGMYLAADWGLRLKLGDEAQKAQAVGLRLQDIEAGEGENSFLFELADELENPFSSTLMLRAQGAGEKELIGWELPKDRRAALPGGAIRLRLPEEKLLLLKE